MFRFVVIVFTVQGIGSMVVTACSVSSMSFPGQFRPRDVINPGELLVLLMACPPLLVQAELAWLVLVMLQLPV